MRQKFIEINDMQDILKLLEDKKYKKYLYRGEGDLYPSINSSGLRKKSLSQLNGKVDFGKLKLLNEIIDDYYREVGYRINDFARNNFLTFSQHHGVPTNLIDVTNSITTALYFATANLKNDYGYVYLFNSEKMIHLSIDNVSSKNITSIYDFLASFQFEKNLNLVLNIYNELKRIFTNYKVENYSTYFWEQVKNIFEVFTKLKNSKDEEGDLEFINICGGILIEINQVNTKRSDYEAFDKIIIKKFKKNSNNNRIKDILQLQNHLNEVLMKAFNHDLAYVVDILTTWIFSMIVYSLRMYISNHNPQVVRMPHILYQPDILFDRMQSQRGSFIYQNYFDHISLQNSSEEIIYPEETLKIKNKAHILKQLDMLGINKKELFPDVDNIAAYTKKKYGY